MQHGVAGMPGWAALVDGRLVLDAADNLPLLSERSREATDLLALVVRQGLA
ncbi:hypothetical protein [Streptomyces kaniharaensis]|uniref:hypothetical protein n=1 Tax=Streptomyces kaniharaensis TaxID=212423 RepID=UPI0012971179|nr:hypothetical protein [Streptomyces kaniharaensis]